MYIPRILLPVGFVHETPFQTARETCTATTAQAGVLDSLDYPGITLEQNLLSFVPVAPGLCKRYQKPVKIQMQCSLTHLRTINSVVMPAVGICKNTVLVLQTAISTDRRISNSRKGTLGPKF